MLLKVLLVGSFGLITISYANGLERIRWKAQHTFNVPQAIQDVEEFVENVKTMSEGKISFRLYKPNALVPNSEMWEAVTDEQLDVAISAPIFYATKIPAINFFAGVPFGPGFVEHTAWMRYGGGQELKDEIYAEKGLKALNCALIPPDTGGWFKKRYKSVEELKGIKIRMLGLGAKVMEKLGAKTILLSFADINPAFEKGKIDAAEFANPYFDLFGGFYKSANFNYYPGWHSQSQLIEVVINKKTWDGLSKAAKTIIETSCNALYFRVFVTYNILNMDAMHKLKSKGVTFVKWKKSELNIIEKAWNEVAEEMSSEDPLFAKVYTKYKAFREKYAIWGDRAFLK